MAKHESKPTPTHDECAQPSSCFSRSPMVKRGKDSWPLRRLILSHLVGLIPIPEPDAAGRHLQLADSVPINAESARKLVEDLTPQENGITQEAIGRCMGVSQSSVSNFRGGKGKLPIVREKMVRGVNYDMEVLKSANRQLALKSKALPAFGCTTDFNRLFEAIDRWSARRNKSAPAASDQHAFYLELASALDPGSPTLVDLPASSSESTPRPSAGGGPAGGGAAAACAAGDGLVSQHRGSDGFQTNGRSSAEDTQALSGPRTGTTPEVPCLYISTDFGREPNGLERQRFKLGRTCRIKERCRTARTDNVDYELIENFPTGGSEGDLVRRENLMHEVLQGPEGHKCGIDQVPTKSADGCATEWYYGKEPELTRLTKQFAEGSLASLRKFSGLAFCAQRTTDLAST